jgi:UDP-N-acetylglucosamine 1-carboxyvinyltransferase
MIIQKYLKFNLMAQKFLVKGGNPLKGQVAISGYKNSAGPVLAATLLSEEPSIISNLPLVTDVLNQIEIMNQIGCEIEWLDDHTAKINAKNPDPQKIPFGIFPKNASFRTAHRSAFGAFPVVSRPPSGRRQNRIAVDFHAPGRV